jgi:hypothetical protein
MIAWLTAPIAALGLAVWGFIEAVQASPAVAGSVATALVGVVGVLVQQRKTEQTRLREVHRERMTPTYDRLLELVSHLADQKGVDADTVVLPFMKDLKRRQLLLGAPAEMLLAFNKWERESAAAAQLKDTLAMALAWEGLLRAIRRDLGHRDTQLPNGELLAVFLDDSARALVAERKSARNRVE